jgi:hypothetical protein
VNRRRLLQFATAILFAPAIYAANPFLDAANDKPVSAQFRGTEWGDDIGEDSPFSAKVITTRLAKTTWGAVFKIEFVDLKSKARKKRKLGLEYFIVTDERIVALRGENKETEVKKTAAMTEPPPFEPGDVFGIAQGEFKHDDHPWETTIEVKGDVCTYLRSHNSGHFSKVVWKKGVGLIEYAYGYGASADGYRLKRAK